jgi:S1-C subfamily serine protease
MASGLTPQEIDRRATLAAEGRPLTDEHTAAQPTSQTWLWVLVSIIVLISFASGGVAGFLGGRWYEQTHRPPIPSDIYWLLGASLTEQDDSVILTNLASGGPAANAGLAEGDRLVSIDGTTANSQAEAERVLTSYSPGSTVLITIERDHRFQQVTVTLGYGIQVIEVPIPMPPTLPPFPVPAALQEGRLGLYYRMVQPEDAFAVSQGAMVISFLSSGGPAETAGLQPGDIITHVSGEALSDAVPLESVLSRIAAGEYVTLDINRGGEVFSVQVWLGS